MSRHVREFPPKPFDFCAVLSEVAIVFFQTFEQLVSFILVPLQLMNVSDRRLSLPRRRAQCATEQ